MRFDYAVEIVLRAATPTLVASRRDAVVINDFIDIDMIDAVVHRVEGFAVPTVFNSLSGCYTVRSVGYSSAVGTGDRRRRPQNDLDTVVVTHCCPDGGVDLRVGRLRDPPFGAGRRRLNLAPLNHLRCRRCRSHAFGTRRQLQARATNQRPKTRRERQDDVDGCRRQTAGHCLHRTGARLHEQCDTPAGPKQIDDADVQSRTVEHEVGAAALRGNS